ncbi:MAG: endo-1,4-beta-xylanase [Melioribacteraceae bacterium]|nr:endo-1,4-beta-xylanase [Melioribacteraceae bacterium]
MQESRFVFKPEFVQKGPGPNLGDKVLTLDENGDPFKSDATISKAGIQVNSTGMTDKFAISFRWNVEGYGFLYMPADNGGRMYSVKEDSGKKYNISYELLRTRVFRNNSRCEQFRIDGWEPSRECAAFKSLGEQYLDDASKAVNDPDRCAHIAQNGLKYSLMAGEMIEIEKSRYDISRNGSRSDFLFGCDTRAYFQIDQKLFFDLFSELFNYGTITHYLKGDAINFEEVEGEKKFSERDRLLDELLKRGIKVEGRPLYWVHTWVTPDWLKNKTYDQLLKYVESHVREVVKHYGDRISVWEVVNELHDWANENQLNHEQTIELTKLACEVARAENPRVKLLVNNCCPFADYVQEGKWHEKEAKYPQRTPHQFIQQLIDAEVDFDIIGVQVYFVHRTLIEAIQSIERYQVFNKKVQLAEVGATSKGVTLEFTEQEKDYTGLPYEWHRHWDEELQADWLEYIFTYGYSKKFIEAANWYDFVDPYGFLKNGGIIKSPKGDKKTAVSRLIKLQKQLNNT